MTITSLNKIKKPYNLENAEKVDNQHQDRGKKNNQDLETTRR